MAIEFSCEKCGKLLRAPKDATGRKCRCPDCGHVAAVPNAGPSSLASASPIEASVPHSEPSLPGKAATSEPNWTLRIVGGMVVVGVTLIVAVAVHGHRSNQKKVAERERLTRLVDEQLGAAKAETDVYEFATAARALDDAEKEIGDSFLSNEYIHDDLTNKIRVARNDIRPLQAHYRKKISNGWVVFEGKLMPGSEHQQILAERIKRAEQQERRRREEDARRRELAHQAELRRQEKERLAVAEKAKADAFFMSQVFVKKKLKVPSTAKFPLFRSPDVTVIYDDDTRKFTVLAWVEAQNPFGVHLRSSYMSTLWPTGGDMWRSDFTNISSP